MYIYDNVVIFSSMWYVLRFEHAHNCYCRVPENDCSFDGLLTFLRESGRHSAIAIFLFWAIKSPLFTVPCNENATRLLQQLRCYLSPLDVW